MRYLFYISAVKQFQINKIITSKLPLKVFGTTLDKLKLKMFKKMTTIHLPKGSTYLVNLL